MFRLIKGNVERVVATETARDLFISKGFVLIKKNDNTQNGNEVGVADGKSARSRSKRDSAEKDK